MQDQKPQENPFVNTLNYLMEQYNIAMASLQVQDYQRGKAAYINSRNEYSKFDAAKSNEQEIIILETYVHINEVAMLNIKSILLTLEQRNDKVKTIIIEALAIIDQAQAALDKLDKTEANIYTFYDMFAFIFRYFELTFQGSLIEVLGKIDQENGKFVNLVEVKRRAVETFMLIDEHIIDPKSPNAAMMESLRAYLTRLAESKEVEVENLIDKNKTIQFLQPIDQQIFIIHGHGMQYLEEFKRIMSQDFQLKPIVLIDEPNQGKTIIEKIEDYGMNCAFAFAIITPDDTITKDGKQYYQARQNVLFELGWFIGRYGRDKVRIIKKRGTELPSDFGGLLTLNFDDKVEEVLEKIKLELTDFGIISSPSTL